MFFLLCFSSKEQKKPWNFGKIENLRETKEKLVKLSQKKKEHKNPGKKTWKSSRES